MVREIQLGESFVVQHLQALDQVLVSHVVVIDGGGLTLGEFGSLPSMCKAMVPSSLVEDDL